MIESHSRCISKYAKSGRDPYEDKDPTSEGACIVNGFIKLTTKVEAQIPGCGVDSGRWPFVLVMKARFLGCGGLHARTRRDSKQSRGGYRLDLISGYSIEESCLDVTNPDAPLTPKQE